MPAPSVGRSAAPRSTAPRRGHRERLDEVVVGPDLQRVDTVVLGAAGADDEDRGADALGAGLLDQAPAVEAREHQVEYQHIGALVSEAGEPDVTAADANRIQPGRGEMLRHPL